MFGKMDTVPNTLLGLGQSISISITGQSKFNKFQHMYENDRIAFVYDCIPDLAKSIADYQLEIL